MKFYTIKELEDYIKTNTIPPELELRKSQLGGNGLYSKVEIPKGTKFPAINCGNRYNSIPELRRYTWWDDGTIYGGIGYYCNGSCDRFLKCIKEGIKKLGPYVLYPYHIRLIDNEFEVITDIPANVEVILDYGDQYFYMNKDYTALITDGYGHWIDLTKLNNFTKRIKRSFSKLK